ncbi:MAG: hypothetical protein IPP61_09950 [Cytophagaceae bacterium]|nr:hypothetical protein [Cytophagaceae bacterium]MBL0302663.1 hypothetical protein [Cytophagaceae bacterium]MBL0325487.1 hypothetical protein [Cytophagaceae bacterium]
MARQSGHVKYVGTIGDIRHFKIKGNSGYFAGLKGGPTGDQVLTAPEFARTRENMSEFTACAMAGKSIRVGFSALMKQMSDPQLTGRLTGIMKKINLEDGSEARGQRAILISQQSQYLTGLDFNKNKSLVRILSAPFTLTPETDRSGSNLAFADFIPANMVNAPAGTTHFRLINALAIVSDFAYNQQSGNYESVDPANNEKGAITYSDYLDIKQPTGNISLDTNIPGLVGISDSSTVLNAIGIEFYQKVNNEYYLLNSGHSLQLVAAYNSTL